MTSLMQVKFLSEMQVRVSEERARLQIEKDKQAAIEATQLELENATAEAANLAEMAKAAEQKAKAKKERKNQQKIVSAEKSTTDKQVTNSSAPLKSGRSCAATLFRLFIFSVFVWILIAVTLVTSMIKYPDYYKRNVVERLPAAYQPLLITFIENVHLGFSEIRKGIQNFRQ